jgi:hypothetical protein
VLVIVDCRHSSCDHLALQTSEAPCLSSKLDDSSDGNFDTFFLFRVREVLNLSNDLINNGTCRGVNSLFCATASECGKQGLLAPYRFFAYAFLANVVAHRCEQGVCLVVPTPETEEERPEDSECYHCRDDMGDIC